MILGLRTYLWDIWSKKLNLEELKKQFENCQECSLCEYRKSIVFGEGNDNPSIVIIGEAPGEEEDIHGLPFWPKAPSGNKLDKILSFLEISRKDIYILNSVLCRPPNNRQPTIEEIKSCNWRLREQINILNPKLIIALGKTAITSLIGDEFKGPLNQFFSDDKFLEFIINNKKYQVMVSYHPSYLLRRSDSYDIVLPHWELVKRWLHEQN